MKVPRIIIFLFFTLNFLNAGFFICNDYKRNLYVEVWQSDNHNEIILYNEKGKNIDQLYIGKSKNGTSRYYGKLTSIYIYKNRSQFSIRYYNEEINKIGNIFGVFNCYAR